MIAQRFILVREGSDAASEGDVAAAVGGLEGVRVLASGRNHVFVSGDPQVLGAAMARWTGWVMTPETRTPRPDPKVSLTPQSYAHH